MTARRAAELFSATYGHGPRVVSSAPGRVNLIGEHTDYNGGQVLPIAISRRTWVAMSPASGRASRAVSAQESTAGTFDVGDSRGSGKWWDYVHGTLRELSALGIPLDGMDVAIVSDVPSGAGLSSSAALEVATAMAGAIAAGARVVDTWDHLAMVAHRAETGFVGVSCGIMDQVASAYATAGHAIRVWCDTTRREQVPFPASVLVIDTVTPRALRASAFNDRQASCARALRAIQVVAPELQHLAHATPALLEAATLGDDDRRRARHVIAETARVQQFVDAVGAGAPLGGLLYASHESLRTDYACSSPELDWVVDFASRQAGVDGARMTGAGWGGCVIAVGSEDGLRDLAAAIAPTYGARWGRAPRTWLTSAEEGADIDHCEGVEATEE